MAKIYSLAIAREQRQQAKLDALVAEQQCHQIPAFAWLYQRFEQILAEFSNHSHMQNRILVHEQLQHLSLLREELDELDDMLCYLQSVLDEKAGGRFPGRR